MELFQGRFLSDAPSSSRRIFKRETPALEGEGAFIEPGGHVSTPQVVGGVTSEAGAWPWAAVLGRLDGNKLIPVCGGTLISRQHILTAAHCFPANPSPGEVINLVRLGEQDVTSNFDGASPVDFEICERHLHARYSRENGATNDIAILKLCKPANLNNFIQPACLPDARTPLPDIMTVVGWGSEYAGGDVVNELQEVKIANKFNSLMSEN